MKPSSFSLRFRFPPLIVSLAALSCFASTSHAGEVLASDDYTQSTQEGRRAMRGDWKIGEGTAHCVQDDELYKKFKDHGPVIWYDVDYHNAVIEFEYKVEGAKTFVFTVNGKDGHVFRYVSSPDRGTRILVWPAENNPDHKSKALNAEGPNLPLGEWVKAKVTLQGTHATVEIGDFKAEVESPTYDVDKVVVGLGFSFGEATYRNFKLSAL